MPGKVATISDLFSPMQSIKTCMDSHGTAITDNLVQLNQAVMSCAATLTASEKLIKNATKEVNKTVKDSLASLNDIMQKQVIAGAGSTVGIAGAISDSITSSVSNIGQMLGMMSNQMTEMTKFIKLIERHTDPKGRIIDKVREKFSITDKLVGSKTIKAPNVTGGKGVSELAKSLATAAREINQIKYVESITLKRKAKRIIGGLLDVFDENKDRMKPRDLKNYLNAVTSLNEIAGNIGEIVTNMSKSTKHGPSAIIGAKLSKIVISNLLEVLEPIGENKSLKKTATAAANLEQISNSLLVFESKMALTSILAVPAMLGTALSGVIIREALFMFKPLGRAKNTAKLARAAVNLEIIATSMLKFSAAMALNLILAVPAMAGVATTALLIKGTTLIFGSLSRRTINRRIRLAALNIEIMSMSMIMFTLSLLATTMISKYILMGKGSEIDPTNVAALASSVGTFGLMIGGLFAFRTIGSAESVEDVLLAGAAISVMAGSFILFTLSLLVSNMVTKAIINDSMKDGKFDVTDILAVAMIAPTYGLMIASYMVYKKIGAPNNTRRVINGGLSILMMSLGFMAFSLSLFVAHQVSKSIIGDIKTGKDVWTLVMDVGVLALMLGSYYLYKRIGSPANSKSVLAGGLSIVMMSLGFVIFSGALYLTHSMIGDMWKTSDGKMDWGQMLKTVGVFGLMFLSMIVFKSVGNNFASVAKGTAGVALMSVGIAAFGFGLTFATNAIKGESAGHLMMIPVLLGTTGLEFGVIGAFAGEVALGSAAVLAMSVGLAGFGYGLHFFVESLKGVEWKTVGMMAALIGIFGAEFALIGIPVVAGVIALGSAAVIGMSGAMYVFGQSIDSFMKPMQSISIETSKEMAGLISIFGFEFAKVGAPIVSPFVLRGAATMIVAGGALRVLAEAMKVWSETEMDDTKLNLLCVSVDRIKLAFQGNPEGTKNEGGFLSKLGSAISGAINAPFDSAAISKTAVSLAIASGAISTLSKALKIWSEVDISDESLKLLCTSVDSIKLVFQGSPDGEKPQGGFLARMQNSVSNLLATPFDLNRMKVTAASMSIAGDAITNLTKGISAWSDAKVDSTAIDNIIKIMVKMKDVFGQIGADDREKGSSLIKNIIGVDFSNLSKTSVERGIDLTKTMGKAIRELAKGLSEFQDGVGSKFRNTTFMEDFAISIGNIVTSLSSTFAQLVSDEKLIKPVQGKKGLFGTIFTELFGEHIKQPKSKIAEGIKTVKDLGSTIKNIAKGMKEFADIVPKNNNSFITDVAAGLSALLQGIQEPLVAFGTTDESFSMAASKAASVASKYSMASSSIHEISAQTMNFQHHKVDVANAIAHVGQIGDLVKGLAEGTKILADPKIIQHIGKAGTITDDFVVGDDATGAVGNIQKLVASNLAIFLKLGQQIEKVGVYDDIRDEVVQDTINGMFRDKIVNKTVKVNAGKKSYIAMAVESAVGIGQVITNLAEGYKNMNEAFPSDKAMTEGVARVGKAISSIMTAFSVIGYALVYGKTGEFYVSVPGNPEMSEMFGPVAGQMRNLTAVGAEPFENAGQSITSIVSSVSTNIKTAVEAKDAVAEFSKMSKDMFESLTVFSAMAMLVADHAEKAQVSLWAEGKGTSYTLHSFTSDMIDSAKKNSSSLKTIVSNVADIFGKMPKEMNLANPGIVESAINLSYVAKAIGSHNDGDTVAAYSGGRVVTYTLRVFTDAIAKSSAENSKFIYDTVMNLSKSTEFLPKLRANYGTTFVDFANKMTKGMNTLAGARKSIQHSTTFIKTLMQAVKDRTFDNISMNTERIASAINTIDNDIFEPYAQMIAALGTMTDKHSEFIKMQKELYELLEKIIDKINGAGSSAGSVTGGSGTETGSHTAEQSGAKPAPAPKAEPSKPLTAKLVPSTVTLTYGNFISEFENMLNRVKDPNSKPSR